MEVLLFMYDHINNRLPASFQNTFPLRSSSEIAYNTRQSDTFKIRRTKSRFIDRLPLYQFPFLWNKSMSYLDTGMSRNCLKHAIKVKHLNSYPTTVNCQNPYCAECH